MMYPHRVSSAIGLASRAYALERTKNLTWTYHEEESRIKIRTAVSDSTWDATEVSAWDAVSDATKEQDEQAD